MQKARRHGLSSAPTGCRRTVSGSLSLPSRGAFHLSLTVLSAIGHPLVFSLGGWSPRIQAGFHVPRPTQDSASPRPGIPTGLSPATGGLSSPLRSPSSRPTAVLQPRDRSRFGLLPFRSPLLRESFVYFLFLQVLRCFSSLSLASLKLFIHFRIPGLYSRWVPPFGHRRIVACLLLPVAFRCLLRPSSPLCA